MKARRRNAHFGEVADPAPFDYALLSHLYVHNDGSDVIDFGGLQSAQDSRNQVQELLRNKSFTVDKRKQVKKDKHGGAAEAQDGAAAGLELPGSGGTYLHLKLESESGSDDGDDGVESSNDSSININNGPFRLMPVEGAEQHIWFVTQPSGTAAPFARLFRSAENLFDYASARNLAFPGDPVAVVAVVEPKGLELRISCPTSDPEPLPITKWIDIQTNSSDPHSAEIVSQVLSRFPIDQGTLERCLYLGGQDWIDVSHMSSHRDSYIFMNVICTPHAKTGTGRNENEEVGAAEAGEENVSAAAREPTCDSTNEMKKHVRKKAVSHNINCTKSVMEMRFDAVRLGKPRSAVAEPVGVAVVAFADWIITIHEEPFAEMDDLLRMIHIHCSSNAFRRSAKQQRQQPQYAMHVDPAWKQQQRFTSAFVFTSLLQIAVGHHLDNITLAEAVDELGDIVFAVESSQKAQDKVIQHITAVRRCFGECGADVTRRESVVSTLLQPHLAHNALLSDPIIRQQLENTYAHLDYLQRELTDCRDTVAVSNWYHNVALHWLLLRRGNSALRMMLLLTEVINIMYPILIVQTLYSMNVPVPFDSGGDPPNTSYAPFFVLAAGIVVYCFWCGRAVLSMFRRKHYETHLLA